MMAHMNATIKTATQNPARATMKAGTIHKGIKTNHHDKGTPSDFKSINGVQSKSNQGVKLTCLPLIVHVTSLIIFFLPDTRYNKW